MTNLPKGSIVALITPFHEDGTINFEKLKELIEWHIVNKTDGILILGTTGESPTLTHEEDDDVVACAIECANHRIPIIVGAGSNSTQTQLEKSLKYEKMGADGLLLISPYYNKANDEGMIRHFTTVADQVHIPIILYNIPGRTGCTISLNALKQLSKHPMIQGIKEASGDISYATNAATLLNDDFVMYSGNDDIIVPMMALGSSGVISVLADVLPKTTHDIVFNCLNGNYKTAQQLQLDNLDLIHDLFMEVNPIPVKEALNMMGFHVGKYRLPLYEMSEDHKAKLEATLKARGLIA
ncbi:4-hydroxy-tetrahydrodipicolinate synthase [Allobaculum stercoricanis]|uniref:4-hydroxy-tetrahydrodipicolinate synthase n=1 Tax=Allobaculum stercoricanis TaxID=174709 RepID=UPI000362F47B|nr:4-hydroxy-tetrahydrodipicolinate synthase [Allobaculum stercoricanis]